MNREERFRDFFRRYALVSLGPEPEKLAEFYDTSFLAAGPKGGAAFKNDETFLSWLRDVHAFNKKTGLTSIAVAGIDTTPVSASYTLATVEWAAIFQRTGSAAIRFSISYLLRDEAMRIAAYISHEDQEDVMRAKGLL